VKFTSIPLYRAILFKVASIELVIYLYLFIARLPLLKLGIKDLRIIILPLPSILLDILFLFLSRASSDGCRGRRYMIVVRDSRNCSFKFAGLLYSLRVKRGIRTGSFRRMIRRVIRLWRGSLRGALEAIVVKFIVVSLTFSGVRGARHP